MAKINVFKDIGQLMTMKGAVQKSGRRIVEKDLGIVPKASLVIQGGRVLWAGRQSSLPRIFSGEKEHCVHGQNIFPGFVDCHTHLVFAGDRVDEFEMRNRGISYQEIANKGGGIQSTVKATRKASFEDLQRLAQARVDRFVGQGVTTLEVKSGYGLSKTSEIKLLKVANSLSKARVVTTFLGAHNIPNEFHGEQEYLDEILKWLPTVQKEKLSRRIDIFIEKGYFSGAHAKGFLNKAQTMGFDITIHADQMSRQRATKLAVELGAKSADHVICLSAKDKQLVAESETTAVLLPTADFYLHCDYPDARGLIDRGGRCALASDFNPGSSPTQNISFVGLLARIKMKMQLPEVFGALTVGGAFALGGEKDYGALLEGYSADFFTSPIGWKYFFYDSLPPAVSGVWIRGRRISRLNAAFN